MHGGDGHYFSFTGRCNRKWQSAKYAARELHSDTMFLTPTERQTELGSPTSEELRQLLVTANTRQFTFALVVSDPVRLQELKFLFYLRTIKLLHSKGRLHYLLLPFCASAQKLCALMPGLPLPQDLYVHHFMTPDHFHRQRCFLMCFCDKQAYSLFPRAVCPLFFCTAVKNRSRFQIRFQAPPPSRYDLA